MNKVYKITLTAGFVLALAFTFTACGSSKTGVSNTDSTVTDDSSGRYAEQVTYGDETYKTVVIGTQIWMAKNLNYDAAGSICYNNDPDNCEKYGRLYNWAKAKEVCPEGWHLPSNEEWDALVAYTGRRVAGANLRAMSGWESISVLSAILLGNHATTNAYGFTALPGGNGDSDNYSTAGSYGYWWSATEHDSKLALGRSIAYNRDIVLKVKHDKSSLYSVRCVGD
jgi:uncharacterized protein (TIGR02145 family)